MTNSINTVVLTLIVGLPAALVADEIPGAPQSVPVLLKGGTIHPVSGPEIENGSLLFSNGLIMEIGTDIKAPDDARIVDLKGKHVYPGLIESHSQIGLTEISAVRATRDFAETGSINPNVRAQISVNPDSEVIPVTRSNGVLLAVTAPGGGLISGQAAVLQLDGWTYEDLTLKPSVGMMVNWPQMVTSSRSPENFLKDRDARLRSLRDLIDDARAYAVARDTNPAEQRFDIRLDAMQPVLRGDVPLIVAADELRQIESAVLFAAEHDLKLIIFGGYDAEQCAELLRRYDVPVIISAIHRNPRRRHDDYDAAYTLPRRLSEAGIRYCISGSDRAETWNARNLPDHAGTAAGYGLSQDEALRSITLSAAEILGIADRVGSLEKGKDATLFVSTGDPLETTSRVTAAWIQGRDVQLDDKQKRLYRKYQEKYRRQRTDRDE